MSDLAPLKRGANMKRGVELGCVRAACCLNGMSARLRTFGRRKVEQREGECPGRRDHAMGIRRDRNRAGFGSASHPHNQVPDFKSCGRLFGLRCAEREERQRLGPDRAGQSADFRAGSR